jgi:hypothetical protein
MSCGNCSYNCCCRCENKSSCRICKIDRCGHGAEYPQHHLCLDCKHVWKTREGSVIIRKGRVINEAYMHDKKDIKDRKKYIGDESYDMKSTSCPFCNNPGIIVGLNFRVPKKNDKKGWELLQKLLCSSYNDLKNMESDKNEKFVYLFYLELGFDDIVMHDYENRWNITDKNNEGYPRFGSA